MNKAEKYIEKKQGYEFHLVEKKFGNGKQLIEFFYNGQINGFKQGFLAYVDNQRWKRDENQVLEEVQNYLLEEIGEIYDEDFIENYREDHGITITMSDIYDDDDLLSKHNEWYKDEFPKICLYGGGVCYFGEVK